MKKFNILHIANIMIIIGFIAVVIGAVNALSVIGASIFFSGIILRSHIKKNQST